MNPKPRPTSSSATGFVGFVTALLSWFVQLGSWFRRWTYRVGLRRSYRAARPVISIGNLGFGGTGKTPTTLALVRAFAARGQHAVVLTRGYGRKYDQPTQVVKPTDDAASVGDEPLLLARSGATVVVDANRARAAAFACAELEPDVLLLDDGFSHHRLARDFDLVLLGEQHLQLWHRRREPRAALRYAHALASLEDVADEAGVALRHHTQLFSLPRVVLDQEKLRAQLAGPVIACAAIAHPERFVATLESLGARPVTLHAFADHRPFPPRFLDDQVAANPGYHVAITEKDAMKLAAVPAGVTVVKIGVELPASLLKLLFAVVDNAAPQRKDPPTC